MAQDKVIHAEKMGKIRWKHTTEWPEGFRICRKCNELKKYDKFHKHRFCSGGYNSVCKKCRKNKSKAHYAKITTEHRLLSSAKSRAKRRGIPFNLTLKDIEIPKKCPVFKIPFSKERGSEYAPSLDRFKPNLGYVKGIYL